MNVRTILWLMIILPNALPYHCCGQEKREMHPVVFRHGSSKVRPVYTQFLIQFLKGHDADTSQVLYVSSYSTGCASNYGGMAWKQTNAVIKKATSLYPARLPLNNIVFEYTGSSSIDTIWVWWGKRMPPPNIPPPRSLRWD